jgi:CubicO group peptidase (beta-lactamase class C family)
VFEQNLKVNNPENGFINNIDSIVVNKMNQYRIPGLSIGLVRNDSIIYVKGYGVKSINERTLVTENSIFHTASISKLFTALAIIELFEKNQLIIDSRLIDILPDLKYDDERVKNITIKSILNHTSGIPDIRNYHWKNNNQSDNALQDFVLGLNLKLESAPFSKYLYSNLGYDILGYVIEKVSGTTFDDYLKENILNKNGMFDSDFRLFKIKDALKTSPHSKRWIGNKVYERKTYPYTREHAPSSTLNSSAKELGNWMNSFMHALENPDNILNKMIVSTTFSNMGLGFQLGSFNSAKTIGHYGGDKGFRSYLLMLPKEKIGLVLLANCDYHEDFRQEILHPIAGLMMQ